MSSVTRGPSLLSIHPPSLAGYFPLCPLEEHLHFLFLLPMPQGSFLFYFLNRKDPHRGKKVYGIIPLEVRWGAS